MICSATFYDTKLRYIKTHRNKNLVGIVGQKTIIVCTLENNKLVTNLRFVDENEKENFTCIDFLDYENKIFVIFGGILGLIKIIDLSTGTFYSFIRCNGEILNIKIINTTIISCGKDCAITHFDFKTLKCTKVFTGHKDAVLTLDVLDNLLLSASLDQDICVWDIDQKDTYKPLTTISEVHKDIIIKSLFYGMLVVSLSSDSKIRIVRSKKLGITKFHKSSLYDDEKKYNSSFVCMSSIIDDEGGITKHDTGDSTRDDTKHDTGDTTRDDTRDDIGDTTRDDIGGSTSHIDTTKDVMHWANNTISYGDTTRDSTSHIDTTRDVMHWANNTISYGYTTRDSTSRIDTTISYGDTKIQDNNATDNSLHTSLSTLIFPHHAQLKNSLFHSTKTEDTALSICSESNMSSFCRDKTQDSKDDTILYIKELDFGEVIDIDIVNHLLFCLHKDDGVFVVDLFSVLQPSLYKQKMFGSKKEAVSISVNCKYAFVLYKDNTVTAFAI